jgi:hypothetical protein
LKDACFKSGFTTSVSNDISNRILIRVWLIVKCKAYQYLDIAINEFDAVIEGLRAIIEYDEAKKELDAAIRELDAANEESRCLNPSYSAHVQKRCLKLTKR